MALNRFWHKTKQQHSLLLIVQQSPKKSFQVHLNVLLIESPSKKEAFCSKMLFTHNNITRNKQTNKQNLLTLKGQ